MAGMTPSQRRAIASCVLIVGAVSLACGGQDFRSMLDEHGGVRVVVDVEPGCSLDDTRQVLDQRIAAHDGLYGAVRVDQGQVHMELSAETLQADSATKLVQPNRVELAAVLSAERTGPGDSGRWLSLSSEPGTFVSVSDPSELRPGSIESARYSLTEAGPGVEATLTPTDAEAFAALTAAQVGKKLAIIVDDVVVSAPVVQEEIRGGVVHITLNDDIDAAGLAAALNTPALPCALTVAELDVLAPTALNGEAPDPR